MSVAIHGFFGLRCQGNRDDDPQYGVDGSPMVNWEDEYPQKRRHRIADSLVIGGLVVAGFVVFLLLHGDLDPQYTQGYFGDIADPFQDGQYLKMSAVLTTAAFSPQNTIDADVKLVMNYTEQLAYQFSNKTLPEYFRIWFEGTIPCNSEVESKFDYEFPCYFDLHYVGKDLENGNVYRDTHELTYFDGGTFDVRLGHYTVATANHTRTNTEFVHIAQADLTSSIYAFKFGFTLTIIAICIGFMNWYQKWRELH